MLASNAPVPVELNIFWHVLLARINVHVHMKIFMENLHVLSIPVS